MISNAKLDELKWKTYKLYDAVDNCNEKFTDLRWVFSEKYVNCELNVKARLVAKAYLEDNSDILRDLPTCSKESMHLVLNIIPSSKWLCLGVWLCVRLRAIVCKPNPDVFI